ncbi:MAG: hypothetical protein M3011_08350 [Actinomycetota bacterium]|nr:hypothetical protein [Actinomycetota bacterium]
MADTKRGKLTTGEIVIVAAGAVDLLFSFFPWYTLGDNHVGAWGTTLFPLATLVPILGTLMLVQVLVDKLSVASLPPRVGDFTWEQLHLVAAVGAAVIVFCYLLVNRGGLSLGFGFYVDLLAAMALVVGAVMIRRERGRRGPSTSL